MPCLPTVIHSIGIQIHPVGRRKSDHRVGLSCGVEDKIRIAPLRCVVGDVIAGCRRHSRRRRRPVPFPHPQKLKGLRLRGLLRDIKIVKLIGCGCLPHHRSDRIPTIELTRDRCRIRLVGVKTQFVFA